MVVEVASSSRPANRTTYKNRKRTQHDAPPTPNKRVNVFRDANVDDFTPNRGEKTPRRVRQDVDVSAPSYARQEPYSPILSEGSTNHINATGKLAVSPLSCSGNATLLSAAPIINAKENADTLSSPPQMLVHPSAASYRFQPADPYPLSSPFKGGSSCINGKYGAIVISSTTRQVRTKSTQNLTDIHQSPSKQSRVPTAHSAGIRSSRPKQRTASSTLTRTAERLRANSWLVPACTGVSRLLAPHAATCVPADQEHINRPQSHNHSQPEEGESSSQSFGMTSFFAGTPDAFSTPVRLTGRKRESFLHTPSPSSPTVIAKSQWDRAGCRPTPIAPLRQRAQRTVNRWHTASSSLENSPTTAHTPLTCSLLPPLAPTHPASSPASPSVTRHPVSSSRNNTPLTPASSPSASGGRSTKHHTVNDPATPPSKLALNTRRQHSVAVRTTTDTQRHQSDIESDMLSLTISDGFTVQPDGVPVPFAQGGIRAIHHLPSEFGQSANSEPEMLARRRKKTRRTISQTDDENITGDDPNALRVSHGEHVPRCTTNGVIGERVSEFCGHFGEPHSCRDKTKMY